MSRSRTAFLSGTITDNPLAVGGTTLNSAGLASLPAIASPDIAVLVLDPTGSAGAPEVIYVTAHTGAATSATISRGKEGSSAREHASGVAWVHGPTLYDFKGWRLEGSQLTEATMTGTSAADLLTVTGLLIPVTQSIRVTGQFRKSAGAAGICGLGLKLNTTVVGEAHTGATANGVAYTVTSNEAESGAFVIDIMPRQANYLRAATGYFSLWGAAGGSLASVMQPVYTADMPNATITDIIIRGISGNGAITLAVDSVYVHVLDE